VIDDDFQRRMAEFAKALPEPSPQAAAEYAKAEAEPVARRGKALEGTVVGGLPVETLRCVRCGMERRRDQPGRSMRLCPECYSRNNGGVRGIDEDAPGFRLAACVTDMRIAIEIATSALKLGKPADALRALEQVKAPGRALQRMTREQQSELP